MKDLVIAGKSFPSRLLLGTGKFASSALMSAAIAESGTAMVTVALKRVEMDNPQDDILSHIDTQKVSLLPNTSGVRNAKVAGSRAGGCHAVLRCLYCGRSQP